MTSTKRAKTMERPVSIYMRTLLIHTFLVLFITGCAGLQNKVETPRVTVADIELVELKLLEQRYRVALRIQNPGRTELSVEGMSFELAIDDKDFAHGVSSMPFSVPAFEEVLVQVAVVSSVFSLFEQLRALEKASGKQLQYRISGKLGISGSLVSIPFEYQGELGPR